MMAKLSLEKAEILSCLLKAARWHPIRLLTKFFFKHMSTFLPAKVLLGNDHWAAFYHPQPDYPLHILIIPKQAIPSIDGALEQTAEFHQELYKIVQALIAYFNLNTRGYRLISNGGPNQLIPQWHWHLVSNHEQELHD